MTGRLLLLCLLPVLAGCAANAPRFLISPPAPGVEQRSRVSTVELRDVSLPAYAAAVEIARQEGAGAIVNLGDSLWADEPVRGVTTALAQALGAATTATVAPEPWPLATPAQARVEVRVTRMLAFSDGFYRLSGQFALASPDGFLRERIETFDISVPLTSTEAPGIADASGRALSDLAVQIARALAR